MLGSFQKGMDTHSRAVGHLARSFFLIPPAPLIKGGAQRAGGSEIGNDLWDWRRITRLRRWTRHNKKCAADSPQSAAYWITGLKSNARFLGKLAEANGEHIQHQSF